jgi:hypothetical protein
MESIYDKDERFDALAESHDLERVGYTRVEFSFPLKEAFADELLQDLTTFDREDNHNEPLGALLSNQYFGLLIAKVIVKSHGGKMMFHPSKAYDENDNIGMSVTVEFPLYEMQTIVFSVNEE